MGIYSKLIDIQKLGQAWDRVRKNKPACGVDNVTYEMFEERRREELRQLNLELKENRYESLPVRLSNIYKGDKARTIALFSMRDKVVQQSLAYELGRIYEPLFSKSTYAYRPGQSALEALKLIEERTKRPQEQWVLKLDIADFFDSIRHSDLLQILEKRIKEQDVLELVQTVLKAKIMDENTGELKENHLGIYQGSSCAPLLSNIYLMDYDREMEARSGFYIRYSDDILILESTEEKARELYEYSKLYMEKKGLKLKESKIQLHRLDEQNGFVYLGYEFTTKGKSVPVKAVSSLTSRLETMWLTSGLSMEEKLKKGQEILGGWEQYYRDERKPGSIIEYVIVLSMVQNKAPEIREEIEKKRFQLVNYYRDIAKYLAQYWNERENLTYAVREYEQFCQVPEEEHETKQGTQNLRLIKELIQHYTQLLTQPSDERYADIMQLYTDLGAYRKAAYFWEIRAKYAQEKPGKISETILNAVKPEMKEKEGRESTVLPDSIDIQDYSDLFVGREDTYVKESLENGNHRTTEQMLEPLTDEAIRQNLSGKVILGTYVQRPNGTSKYVVFDIDISKKILIQYSYESAEFDEYKQKAAEYAGKVCRILKRMGLTGYVEDSGFRGYHVWIFFTEWIPVRYLNQLEDCVQKELGDMGDDIVMELFPNRTKLRQGKCGQKIKLPLGIHIRTGNRSFFVDEQFCPINDYKEFFAGIAKYSLTAVRKILGMYALAAEEKPDIKEVDRNLERFGSLSESIRIVLEKCSLMRYLCQKAATTGYLSHFERLSVLYVFGHMGDAGKEFVHTVMGFTLNYQYSTTQKFITKLPEKPVSCVKLREQYKLITAEYGCSCNFKRTKNCYPSPVLHAIKNSDDEQSDITVPMSRTMSKAKEEKVYEEINIHKQTEKLAQRIVELKKQKRGLDKSIRKTEAELQTIFDNAGIDCLEIAMGLLVRRKKGEAYEWLIEL